MKHASSSRLSSASCGADPVEVLPPEGFIGRLQRRFDVPGFVVSEARDDPRHGIPPHQHVEAHFFFPMDEGFTSSARGAAGPVGVRTMLYHPPLTAHADSFVQRGGRFLVVHLIDARLCSADEGPSLPDISHAYESPEVSVIRERIRIASRQRDASSTAVLESLLLELLDLAQSRLDDSRRPLPSWLKDAVDLIMEDPRADLTVREIARTIGVHPVSLARAFRRNLAASPGDYLRWRRIDRALDLLRRKKMPLAHVALEAGFADQSSFTRAYRRIMRTTPGAYRRHLAR